MRRKVWLQLLLYIQAETRQFDSAFIFLGAKMKIYSAGEIAKILKIPYYSLDYMERRGKIPAAKRTTSNQRYYTEEDFEELKEILLRIKKNEK